jgi:hypothetical protein
MPTKPAPFTIPEPTSDGSILADYITRDEILRAFGKCVRTWFRLEQAGDGPPRTVIGKQIFYRRDKFKEWMLSHEERGAVRLSANGRPRKLRKPAVPAGRVRNARRARG